MENNKFKFNESTLARMRSSFSEFVHYVAGLDTTQCDSHLRLQSTLIDLDRVDFIGRMEAFDDDFATIRRRLDLPVNEVIHRNASVARKPYQEYYDAELRERVRQIYLKDIQIFGYRFDGIST